MKRVIRATQKGELASGRILHFVSDVRSRIALQYVLLRAGQAILIGSGSYLLLLLLLLFWAVFAGDNTVTSSSSLQSAMLLACAVALGYFLLRLIAFLLNPLSTADIAKFIDNKLELNERFSTAVSIEGQSSPLSALLITDLESKLRNKDAAKIVTTRNRSLVKNLAFSFVFLSIAQFAWFSASQMQLFDLEVIANSSGQQDARSMPVDIDAVEELTYRVIEDAEAADDAYLEALSKALAQFSAEVRSPELDEAAASRQLEGLLEQLNEAYAAAEMTAPTYEPLAQQAQTPPSELDQALEAEQLANQEEVDPASDPENQSPEAQTSQAQTADEDFSSQGTSEDGTAEDSTADTGESGTGEFSAGPPQGATPYGDYMQPSAEVLAQQEFERMAMARVEVEQPAGGDMGGAGDGSSIEAGHGSQDLFGDSQGELAQDDLKAGEELELPYEEVGSRRITVDAAPQEILSEVEETSLNTQGWRRLEESAMGVEELDLRHRTVAANYFYEIARLANDAARPAN